MHFLLEHLQQCSVCDLHIQIKRVKKIPIKKPNGRTHHTEDKKKGRPKDAQLAGTKEGRELVPLTRLKLDEEKRKCAGLAQENGFG
jgi:hypothetical protein